MRRSTYRIPGLVLSDHEFELPLDHHKPDGAKITVFAREVVDPRKIDQELPWMLFLQGGPGYHAPRPEDCSGWLKRALQEYRVLLLDQRGTGRSSIVLAQTMRRFVSPQVQADYLKLFRADAIVQDAELIRRQLLGDDQPWSVLGQSYGGFCAVHYLSAAPESLREVVLTGGLPPLTVPVDEVYRATYQRVIEKNHIYFERYMDDRERIDEILEYLGSHAAHLPGGGRLDVRRFQQLGIAFGASNGFEQVHYLLESAFVPGVGGRELSYTFLRGVENAQLFEEHPIYAVLHEPIYCQGEASRWSAERVRQEFPQFALEKGKPFYFTGEMVYPWMFDEYEYLKPLQEAAEILANYEGWPYLYDISVLANNQVPCAAAVYYNDMYVDRRLSEQAARKIKGIKLWVTSEHEHSALRLHGELVLDHLLGLLNEYPA